MSCLPASEQDRIGARAQPHRRRALCAHAALRILASAATTGTPPLPELAPDSRGKPTLRGRDGRPRRLRVSLSHAGAYAAVSLCAEGPVGVDIEAVDRLPDRERFARGIMSRAERDAWQAVPEHARDTEVIRAFTRKEAVLKALGTGLAGDLRQVATEPGPTWGDQPVRLRRLPAAAGPLDDWTVLDLAAPPGLCGAVAVHAPAATVHQHRTTIAELLRAAPPTRTGRPPRPTAPEPAPRATVRDRGDRPVQSIAPTRSATALDAEPATGPQVFCLPHAGGSSAHFHRWNWLAPYARVVPVDLPGHGRRLGEPLVTDWDRLAADLTESIAAQVDGPYVLFGHSLGALLAFEVAHRMLNRGPAPALLVAAGRNGPSAEPGYRPIHELPDARFLSALHALGGMPEGLLRQAELLRMFLPVLRADLRLAERYERPAVPPLPLPVMAFAGHDDPMTNDLGLLAWKRETTRSCELVFLDGTHFFLDSPEFAGALTERIARLVHPVTVG
ncbi:alpha/beta fold hydrolase [Kitasatospora sp. SUK 42]|uniref:alpha/beta fold hydrolase n=1 Tax=Kitasatospora sp. SUK 42 TaxID=1588882 RepID=UPI001C31B71D|nr:alpha/beta fold hydrolase [Kitasatospora sp. SUK 42]MBV2156573.1 alpha/beta fold hydrolase [Kitasatospora sp. SUK 42]